MKKILSTALCTAMILGSVSAFADVNKEYSEMPDIRFLQQNGYLKGRENGLELESHVTRAEALTMLLRVCDEENAAISGEEASVVADYEVVSGEFVRTEESGIVINTENGEVLINTENTLLRGTSVEEAKEGNLVSAVVSTQRTRSIPAMVKGYVAVISETTAVKAIDVAEVEEEDGVYQIVSADGEYIVAADENTVVTPFATRNIMKIDDISEGDRIFVLSDVMTMSIPAQLMPNEIIVFENALEDVEIEVDDTADETEEASIVADYEVVSGEFVRTEESGIVINTENGEVLINTENTLLRGTSVEEAKEGNLVSAVVSAQRTRSIPAMVKGYVAVISETTAVKAIDVAEVEEEDGVYQIVSADGEYIVVADENTVVTPFATRNIMKIDDISEGDRIFVLSDVMTMSIPAQLMPNEIIVFENALEENDDDKDEIHEDKKDKAEKAEKVGKKNRKEKDFKDAKGHWAEKIIKYSYKKGYVDGESETHFNPEGKVKGREMVKMMLSKIGKEDITIENAYKVAKECGLIDEDTLEEAIENNEELTREEMAKLCYKMIKVTKPDVIEKYETTK